MKKHTGKPVLTGIMGIEIRQSHQIAVIEIVTFKQSIPSPDED